MRKITQNTEHRRNSMFYTILNFMWIFCSTFLLSFAITDIFGKYTGRNIFSLDYILISGLMVATV